MTLQGLIDELARRHITVEPRPPGNLYLLIDLP
jgi:hypothetical protein